MDVSVRVPFCRGKPVAEHFHQVNEGHPANAVPEMLWMMPVVFVMVFQGHSQHFFALGFVFRRTVSQAVQLIRLPGEHLHFGGIPACWRHGLLRVPSEDPRIGQSTARHGQYGLLFEPWLLQGSCLVSLSGFTQPTGLYPVQCPSSPISQREGITHLFPRFAMQVVRLQGKSGNPQSRLMGNSVWGIRPCRSITSEV